MPTKTDIKNRIQQLNPAAFQILCDDYLGRTGYPDLVSFGTMAGAERTTKGTPDSYCVSNGKYIFAEYTVQATGLVAKIKKDIDKCFDESETHVPVDQISEIVYCHTSSNLSPGDDRMLRGYCAEQGVLLTLIGIDKIADDIFWTYKTLAKEHLGLQIGTAQIQTADDYIREYDSDAFAAPLDTCFLAREDKLKELADAFSNNNTVIVTGAAGVGKTRLSIEFARKHALENDEKLFCIHSRALGLNDDLCSYFEKTGNYFIVVDDANQISELSLVIDLVKTQRKGFCFHLLLTVRDYATENIKRIIGAVIRFDEIKLEKLKDDEIKNLVKNHYGIRNPLYLERIAAIAEGNARMAMMAGKIAAESNRLESIKDATGLYDEYYKPIITGAELDAQPELLPAAGIAAFLSPFHIDFIDSLLPVLEPVGVSKDTFVLSLKYLHELEIVDICNDKAVKISDQCFGNYLLKLVFCDKKALSLRATIAIAFFSFKEKTIEAISTLFRLFGESDISEYIIQEIMAVWNQLKGTDPTRFWEFFKAFYPVNPIEALCELKKRIKNTGSISLSADQMDTDIEGNKRSHSENDEVITVLSGFAETGALDDALDLFFQYYLKRPDLYYQFYRASTNTFGIKKTSSYCGYYTQIHLLTKLFEYSDNWTNDYILILFLDIAKEFLRFEFTPVDQTRDGKGVNWYRISLSYSDEVSAYRRLIWEQLILISKTGKQPERIREILSNYGRGVSESGIEIVREESSFICQTINDGLSPDNLEDCLAVKHIISFFEQNELNNKELQGFLDSPVMKAYQILAGPSYSLDDDYMKHDADHKAAIKEYLSKDNTPLEAFSSLLFAFRSVRRPDYSAFIGLNIALEELAAFQTAFIAAIKKLLSEEKSTGINQLTVISRLFSVLPASDVLELIKENCHSKENTDDWLFAYYHELPQEYISEVQLNGFYRFLADDSVSLQNVRNRDLSFLEKYKEFDHNVFPNASRIILEKLSQSPSVVNSYFPSWFRRHSRGSLDLFQLYTGNMDILEDIYFLLLHNGEYMDHEGRYLLEFAKMDIAFPERLSVELLQEADSHALHDVDTRYAVLYNLENYVEVIDRIINHAIPIVKYPSWDVPKIIRQFIVLPEGKAITKNSRDEWIAHYIAENAKDLVRIEYLFEALSEGSLDDRRKLIQLFIAHNSDFDSFKELPILPRSYSVMGSSIPLYNNWVKYLESLLSIFHGIHFIEHKDYILKQIEMLRKMIRKKEIEDFITR